MSVTSATALSSQLSAEEVSKAKDYLDSTRTDLLEALEGLSEAQWNFKPAEDRWSIAETLEHVVIVEGRVHSIVDRMQDAPPYEPERNNSEVEAIILAKIPNRTPRIQAPPHILPSHQTPGELIAQFRDLRTRTLDLLVEAPFLRGHVIPHPILGSWDGYQWILGVAAHCARHTNQILEVKGCPGYPDSGPGSSGTPR